MSTTQKTPDAARFLVRFVGALGVLVQSGQILLANLERTWRWNLAFVCADLVASERDRFQNDSKTTVYQICFTHIGIPGLSFSAQDGKMIRLAFDKPTQSHQRAFGSDFRIFSWPSPDSRSVYRRDPLALAQSSGLCQKQKHHASGTREHSERPPSGCSRFRTLQIQHEL